MKPRRLPSSAALQHSFLILRQRSLVADAVQIPNQLLELNLIDIIRFSKRVDVDFNQVIVGHGLRQVEACSLLVIYLGKPIQQFVEQMQLLDLETCCIRVWLLFLCHFVR